MASNNTNDFYVQLMAALDPTSVNKEFDALKKKLAKDPVIQKVTLDTSMSKQAIKDMATEIHNELGKAFKETGIESFDITVKDVESILASAVKESNKLAKELDTASSKAQKFLAQFNNKSGGTLVNSKEFKAVQDAINGLGNTHTIDDLNKAMNTLETTYNNMVSSLRNSGKSLNPFINAKNEMATMDDTIKGIGLEFEKLANKPKAVSDAIKQLSVQQANVNSHTIGTQEWADAYGKLQQMIQKVKSEISNLQKAQSAKVAVQIFDPAELDKQGRIYVKKVNNTIEKTKSEIESKLRNDNKNRWTDIQITGIEKANGQIKSLTVQATNAAGAFKELRFEAQKIATNSKKGYQTGLVQTSEVKTLKGNMSQMRQTIQSTLDGLKSKWQEQGVLVGEFKTKVEQLQTSLASVGSKGELNNLKSQMESLKTQASQIAEVNKIQLLSNGGIKNDYATQIAKLEGDFRSLGLAQDTIATKTQNVKNSLATLRAEFAKPVDQQNFQAIQTANDNLQRELIESRNEFEQLRASMKGMATEQQRLSLANTIEAWNQKNTAATKAVREENERYVISLRDLSNQMTRMNFNKINTGFKQNENSMRTLHKLGASLKDQFSQAATSFTQWLSVSSGIMLLVSKTKDAVVELKELDDILTEITKTSDLTEQQLKKLGDSAYDTASKYGRTASDYLTGVQEMYRAGFDNAEQMAELSVLAQSAGDMDSTLSNDYLLATNAAYKYKGSVEELNKVLDSQNYITNNAAISMKDIADATTETASVAAQYGVQIDELSALIATATANTRESGAEVGTALKAILINLQDTTSKPVTETFDALGISMTKVENGAERLKTPIELIHELADAYNSLPEGDIMRANILNEIGQKRHANTLAAVLSDMEAYNKMLELYNSNLADDSAYREAEKSANNFSGSLNKLRNTWTDTVDNILNSDTLTTGVNVLNDLLGMVNKLTDALGGLGTVGLAGGLLAGIKNVG